MTTTMDGRRVLVTGAASGIGKAVALHLSELQADLVVSDLPGPSLEALADELPKADVVPADLSAVEQVEQLVQRAGPVDILVNNAGIQHVSPVDEFSDADWDRLMAVMLSAPFRLTRGVLPGMYRRQWGRIVNVASVHGLVASPFKVAYVAAKHGLLGMTKTVALEASARCPDVTAHAVCPSYVRTPLVERQIAEQAAAHGIPEEQVVADVLLASNAVKRLIEPEQVAEAVAWLCGPMAWTMTGGALSLDAGWLAH